jgi:hypothetical protein
MLKVGKKSDILTTVRLQDVLFEDFKIEAARNRITMRNLLERSMYLYLTDPEFKRIINNQLNSNYTRQES